MSTATESVLFNALPLLVLAGVYVVVTAAVVPSVWRNRRAAHPLELAIVLVFPLTAVVASLLGALVLVEQEPVGGRLWITFAATCAAFVPAILFLSGLGDRAFLAGGIRRAREAQTAVTLRDRDLGALAAIATALTRARDLEGAARPLVEQVRELLDVELAAVALVDDEARYASGVVASCDLVDVSWWQEVRLDLRNEPSLIASVVFDAAPVTVFDLHGSARANPGLAARVGAQSGVWVPIVAEERVIGVVVGATIGERRAFTQEEVALLQALAGETALALDRIRSADALAEALAKQSALLQAARVVTAELDLDIVLRRLVEEVTKLLDADAADCYLLDRERGVLRCVAVHGFDNDLVGFECSADRGLAGVALRRERPVASDDYDELAASVDHDAYSGFRHALAAPMVRGGEVLGVLGVGTRDPDRRFEQADVELLEAFADLASLALRNAESFRERARQAHVQRSFHRIASLLSGPLSLAETLDAAARAAADAVGGGFAAVLVVERERLALAAGHGLPEAVRALEAPPALLEAARDGRTIAAPRVTDDDRFDDAWRQAPFASLLAIPLESPVRDDPLRGLVVVFFPEPHAFSEDDLELARQVGRATRDALERSRLYETERTSRALSQ